MANVLLKNVRKLYPNGYEAVKDFSLTIGDGEFIVLVGPSGCGKSTTLRMIAGLEDVSAGDISIGDRVVNDVHPKDRDIAMVFQNYALYPHMSVYKNMAFALKLRKVPKEQIDQRVQQAARMLGIEDLLDRKPRALSGGQRQRVAVGRAIVREPKAFLFDEPLSNLDAKLRVTTRAELKGLHQRLKTTTVYVTHDQEEAMTLGDRIVVMSKGLIQQADTPLNVYKKPANRFVASFVGTPPMNFVEGTLENAGGLSFIENGGKGLRVPVAPEHQAKLAPFAGKPLAMGLRPQVLIDTASGASRAPGLPEFDFPVSVIEPLGDTMDLFGATGAGPGATRLVARVHARAGVGPGSTVRMAVNTPEAHYFEPGEFGRNLLL